MFLKKLYLINFQADNFHFKIKNKYKKNLKINLKILKKSLKFQDEKQKK